MSKDTPVSDLSSSPRLGFSSPHAPLRILHRHATALNLGDEALCLALYDFLPRDASITELVNEPVVGLHPGQQRTLRDGQATLALARATFEELARADVLLVGGGDLILGYPVHYGLLRAARLLGTPILQVGVGVNLRGAGRLTERMATRELPRVRHFWVRDAASQARLTQLGVAPERLTLVPDLTYTLDAPRLCVEAAELPPWRVQLAPDYMIVSVRAPEGNSLQWGEPSYRALAEALDRVIETRDVQPVFLPMLSAARDARRRFTGATLQDEAVAAQVIALMRHPERALLATGDLDTRQALRLIAGARLTVGTRLHSLIFSTLVHTPMVALSYNLKTESFMRELGWESRALRMDTLEPQPLTDAIGQVLAEREQLAQRLAGVHAERRAEALAGYASVPTLLACRRTPAGTVQRARAWASWLAFKVALAVDGSRSATRVQ